jgi:hypothetical protein
MATPLDPTGRLINLSPGVRLRTPGLRGNAESHRPLPGGGEATRAFREVERSTSELERALDNEHVRPQATVEIAGAREVAAAAAAAPTRSTPAGEPAIELQVAAPNQEQGQFVLSIDEAGVTTWNFARAAGGELDATRGGELRTYLIPRYVAPRASAGAEGVEGAPGAAPAERGLFGAVGRKLLKVLVFPLVEDLLGEVGEHYAHRWEESKRPYRLRSFTPADYAQPDGAPVAGGRWQELGRGRALLMVHGTFSRAHTAFAGLSTEIVGELHRIYEGRVFAFDHYTLSEDPRQNVQWLLDQIPDRTKLELDIICHSRGGLVSRELSEKQAAFSLGSRELRVGRIVFVAAPNAGTALADGRYLGDFIDSYTNLLNFFPTSGVAEVLEGIVTVAKMLAVGVLAGLPGLQSMNPGGAFLADFNRGRKGDDRYFALASNFDPQDPGLKAWAVNRLLDRIFQHAGNDLVVPTAGVYDRNGSDYFPIADRLVFTPDRGIWHGGFFSEPDAQRSILHWLTVA